VHFENNAVLWQSGLISKFPLERENVLSILFVSNSSVPSPIPNRILHSSKEAGFIQQYAEYVC